MRIYMKNKLLVLITFLSINVHAGWTTSSGKVLSVYSHNGNHVIRTTLTDSVCQPGNYWWPKTDGDAQDMFSLALTAFVAGKEIRVQYDSSDLDCQYGNSAKVTHMVIQ